jgi:hypothetical protein
MEVSSYSTSTLVSTDNSNVIPFEDDKIHGFTQEDEEDINMLFMINETVLFKDGQGINQEVTCLGPIHLDGTLKHKIRTRNDTEFAINSILLSSLNKPGIATIPLTPEQYADKLPKLSEAELQQIPRPFSLDDDQQEFMALHYKMNHLPLPAMIVLAENGKLQKKFAKLKHQLPVCMSCIFGKAHRKPWRSKGPKGLIRKESNDSPRICVSMDQLVSAQPGLIPQMA